MFKILLILKRILPHTNAYESEYYFIKQNPGTVRFRNNYRTFLSELIAIKGCRRLIYNDIQIRHCF
jgi:hypothetical protein